jgi:hypothetical protein
MVAAEAVKRAVTALPPLPSSEAGP